MMNAQLDINLTRHHLLICSFRDGKKMRWHLITSLASIHSNDRVGVDWITLVWVDDNAKQSRVGLNSY